MVSSRAKNRIHTTAPDQGISIEIFTERISKLLHIYAAIIT